MENRTEFRPGAHRILKQNSLEKQKSEILVSEATATAISLNVELVAIDEDDLSTEVNVVSEKNVGGKLFLLFWVPCSHTLCKINCKSIKELCLEKDSLRQSL